MAKRRQRGVRLARAIEHFIRWERVCRVATVGGRSLPHVVPVCHVLVDGKLYFGSGRDARKVLNLRERAQLAVAVDVYTDDWKLLRGVLLQGPARIVEPGGEFRRLRRALYLKYPQYPDEAAIDESDSVIVELTPTRLFTWGFD